MKRRIKRILDVSLAVVALVVLSPLLGLVALFIYLKMGKPVLFRQIRPGHKAKPFTLLKFRTMNTACDPQGCFLPDGERLTSLGKLLRQFSIDELPQLWNVLIGDMSLVGPRPLPLDYLPRYSAVQARRHEVKPGLTGWAQVNGRNAIDWGERLRLDIWYVDHWSLGIDFKIIWKTVPTLFKREGISKPGHATMPEFVGDDQSGL